MAETAISISCEDCVFQRTEVCKDCVVSYILDVDPDEAIVIDAAEARAVRLLERAGLVPSLRHERRAG